QRGHGLSDAPDAGYDLDTAVADLLTLIDTLELDRPVLAGQSWGGNVVLELGWRRPDAVRGIACVDGGVIELSQAFPPWEDCLAALTPPALDHLTLAELETRIRKSVPHFTDRAVQAYLHCFRTRPDGTIEARLQRSHHLSILRSLWEHRPSTRWATLKTPTLLLLADGGDASRTSRKRSAEAVALEAGGAIRSVWFAHRLQLAIEAAGFLGPLAVDHSHRTPLAEAAALSRLRTAGFVFAGPGSPSYALSVWRSSPVPEALTTKLAEGGAVVFSSAAALTLGRFSVPVYEIYKVGLPVHWLDGLDLMRAAGFDGSCVVIPHYDNAEGGTHDTRFCYLGERRLAVMEGMLPDDAWVLGIDEHTVLVADLDAKTVTVSGRGGLTVRRRGTSRVFP